jgi:hypothetical protein
VSGTGFSPFFYYGLNSAGFSQIYTIILLNHPVKNSLNFRHPSRGIEYFAVLFVVVRNLDLIS